MALLMHPNTLKEFERESLRRMDFMALAEKTMTGSLGSFNGENVKTSAIVPEFKPKIEPLSTSLVISAEVRAKVNATLEGFGRERVVFRIADIPGITFDDIVSLKTDLEEQIPKVAWRTFY